MKNIIKETAKQNNTSVKEVRREIGKAIDEGMKCTDPYAVEFWKQFGGQKPTVEEFLKALSACVSNEIGRG
ncbi:MAG: hypothetical protein IK990_19065 [Ruminiclostridium sp.]|nr:hypothetical protein [Ruminiclostridium sp.]